MKPWAFLPLVALSACSLLESLTGGDAAQEYLAKAESLLSQGDIPQAIAAYQVALREQPDSIPAANGVAYGLLLQQDYTRADTILAAAQEFAALNDPPQTGPILLRRCLVALAAGNLDNIREWGQASGMDQGRLLAAEVALADGEREAAVNLLEQVRNSTDSDMAGVASDYLALLGDSDPRVQGLSEAQALWALGQRKIATRSVEELLKTLPDQREDRATLLLLWAGRAAAAGEVQVASNLLESIDFPPPGQQWRVLATRAIVACAEGDSEKCGRILDGLNRGAPPTGLADARATAAALLANKDPQAALRVSGVQQPGDVPRSAATARALLEAGHVQNAGGIVAEGIFSSFVDSLNGG